MTKIRTVRGREVPRTPPWKAMLSVAAIGAVVIAVGVHVGSGAIAVVGASCLVVAAGGFLVPGFREQRKPQQVDRESYAGFVLSLLRGPAASQRYDAGQGGETERHADRSEHKPRPED